MNEGRAWLTEAELVSLTNRVQVAAQCRVLDMASPPIRYRLVDGRPIVPRAAVVDTPETYEPQLRLIK